MEKKYKQIIFEYDVVTTEKYKYENIVLNMFKFGDFKNVRNKHKQSVPSKCFVCGQAFEEDDYLALLGGGNHENKLCCSRCGQMIFDTQKEVE